MDSTENSGSGKMKDNPEIFSRHYVLMMTGRLMPLMALFAATILYSHLLRPEDYGLYQSIWMYVNLVSVIIGFGVTTVIFSSQAATLHTFIKNNRSIILSFYAALWTVTFLAFALAAHQYSLSLKIWVIVFMMLQASNTITETWLIKNGGAFRYYVINIVYGGLLFLWHYLVLRSGFDIDWLLKGIVCLSVAKFLSLITFYVRNRYPYRGNISETKTFSHWIYNGANDILGVLSKWVDKLILIYLLTPAEFAIFFNGSIEIPLISIFISFTGSLMMVNMAERLQSQQSLVPVFRENFLLLSAIAFPLFFFLFFFSKPVFLLFFGPQYLASVPVFMITILILPLRINTYGSILQVMGKGKRVTQGSVIDLVVCIILILVLYPLMGMRGAALALVISTLVQIIYYLRHSKALLQKGWLQLIPVKQLLIRFAATGVLFWIAQYIFTSYAPFTRMIAGCILMAVCTLIIGNKYFTQILRAKRSI